MKRSIIFGGFVMMFLLGACATPSTPTPVAPSTAQPAAAPAVAAPTEDAAPPEHGTSTLTARMLTAPNALAGPGPSSFNWSPTRAVLVYVESQGGEDVLWLYDAVTGEKKVLLDPAKASGNIDVTSAQWSPSGDRLLLSGDEALWLLDVSTGDLQSLLADGGAKTGIMFTPDGDHVSYVQGNNLKVASIAGEEVKDLTTDGERPSSTAPWTGSTTRSWRRARRSLPTPGRPMATG